MKVVKRNLNKDNVWGWAHTDKNKIEVHNKLKGKRLLLYMVHEALHIIHPEWSETKVKRSASRLTAVLWKQGYRKIEL